jgi:hypothetical protein
MFLLTLVKGVPFQLFLLPSNVLFDQVSFVPFHLYPMEGEGGGIFQMFFFNSGRMYLLTSACGGGGISNVLLNSGRLYLLTSACGGGGISNVLLNSGRLYLFTSAWEGGGGIFTDCGDYIMSWFTLSILYIIFSSFNLILSCERV